MFGRDEKRRRGSGKKQAASVDSSGIEETPTQDESGSIPDEAAGGGDSGEDGGRVPVARKKKAKKMRRKTTEVNTTEKDDDTLFSDLEALEPLLCELISARLLSVPLAEQQMQMVLKWLLEEGVCTVQAVGELHRDDVAPHWKLGQKLLLRSLIETCKGPEDSGFKVSLKRSRGRDRIDLSSSDSACGSEDEEDIRRRGAHSPKKGKQIKKLYAEGSNGALFEVESRTEGVKQLKLWTATIRAMEPSYLEDIFPTAVADWDDIYSLMRRAVFEMDLTYSGHNTMDLHTSLSRLAGMRGARVVESKAAFKHLVLFNFARPEMEGLCLRDFLVDRGEKWDSIGPTSTGAQRIQLALSNIQKIAFPAVFGDALKGCLEPVLDAMVQFPLYFDSYADGYLVAMLERMFADISVALHSTGVIRRFSRLKRSNQEEVRQLIDVYAQLWRRNFIGFVRGQDDLPQVVLDQLGVVGVLKSTEEKAELAKSFPVFEGLPHTRFRAMELKNRQAPTVVPLKGGKIINRDRTVVAVKSDKKESHFPRGVKGDVCPYRCMELIGHVGRTGQLTKCRDAECAMTHPVSKEEAQSTSVQKRISDSKTLVPQVKDWVLKELRKK